MASKSSSSSVQISAISSSWVWLSLGHFTSKISGIGTPFIFHIPQHDEHSTGQNSQMLFFGVKDANDLSEAALAPICQCMVQADVGRRFFSKGWLFDAKCGMGSGIEYRAGGHVASQFSCEKIPPGNFAHDQGVAEQWVGANSGTRASRFVGWYKTTSSS